MPLRSCSLTHAELIKWSLKLLRMFFKMYFRPLICQSYAFFCLSCVCLCVCLMWFCVCFYLLAYFQYRQCVHAFIFRFIWHRLVEIFPRCPVDTAAYVRCRSSMLANNKLTDWSIDSAEQQVSSTPSDVGLQRWPVRRRDSGGGGARACARVPRMQPRPAETSTKAGRLSARARR